MANRFASQADVVRTQVAGPEGFEDVWKDLVHGL